MVTVKKKNGFTMIELVGAMIIIAVLTVGGITAISTAISNSRVTACKEDLAGFRKVLETFCMENPQYAKGADASSVPMILEDLNSNYLEGEMKLAEPFSSAAESVVYSTSHLDPWGNPYRLHMSIKDAGVGTPPTKSTDSLLRFLIVSSGKNANTVPNGEPFVLDGTDDIAEYVQILNGAVSTQLFEHD
ncbi:MAG: type II secretion system protein [Acinetobacter sp.]